MKRIFVKKSAYFSLSILLALLLIFSTIFSVNIVAVNKAEIKNGDFENGISDFQYSSYLEYSVETGSDNVHQGSKSIKLGAKKGAWNNAFLYQSVSVEKQSYYEWHLWFKSENETNKPCIGVRTEDGKYLLPSTLSSVNGGFVDSARSKFKEKRLANNSENWNQGLTSKSWKEYVIAFYSEEETNVLLTLDMFYNNRSGFTDDWSIIKTDAPVVGEIRNGNFDDSVNYYTNDKLSQFEVIDDSDIEGNKILKVSGNSQRGSGIVYQKVTVKPGTDYSWTLRFNQSVNERGDYCKLVVNTPTWQAIGYKIKSANVVNDKWGIKSMRQWGELQVIFNSGENEEILLGINIWADTVTVLTDDWVLSEYSDNVLANRSFEEPIQEFNNDSTLSISQATTNVVKGDKSLYISGKGLLSRVQKVNKYNELIWRFNLKSTAKSGTVKAAVISKKTGKLIPCTVTKDGKGTITPENSSESDNILDNYFTINTTDEYTKYEIKFNPYSSEEIELVISFPENSDFYSDEWYLGGDLAIAYETLYNPGFEDGDSVTYSNDPYIKTEVVSTDAHSGKYALKISKDETIGSGYFWQTVNVKENSDYLWTFWAKFNSTSTPVGAEPRISGGGLLKSHMDGDVDTVIEPSFVWHRIRYSDTNWHKYSVVLSTGSNDKIDLAFLAYASQAEVLLDDWTIEYLSETPNTAKIIDVGFESEKMGAHEYSKQAWNVTDAEAHSGTHSIEFFGRDAIKGNDLLYRDKNGVICDNTYLSTNTKYRFSFWYKGKGKIDLANIRFNVYTPGKNYLINNYYGCENEEWNYFEYIFNTEDSTFFRFQIATSILGSAAFSMYVDDIELVKLQSGITGVNEDTSEIDADSEKNIISDGSIQNSDIDADWNDLSGAKVVFDETDTNKVIEMGSGKNTVFKGLKLNSDKEYRFSIKYRYKKNNGSVGGKLGLLCNSKDSEGELQKNPTETKVISRVSDDISLASSTKLITNRNSWDDWTSFSFDFIPPEDGIVYVMLDKTSNNGLIQFDDIYLECLTPDCAPVKDMTKIQTEKSNKKSVWDLDFDFDLDWNEDALIEPEEEPFEIDDVVEKKNTSKKYLQVKRRKLIEKGNPEIPDWIIIVSISAAVLLVGGLVAITIIIIKKKKRKNI